MRELVEVLAKALVEYPDQIEVTEAETDKTIHLRLTVAPSDMGKVIGKQGKTANAIRTIVKAAAVKDGRKVILDVDQ
ncbi:MAG: KH domain-containing protein [Peptococcaceae bacterium]|nr:KH domain-containing protein [Peptococcaceae bacterium]